MKPRRILQTLKRFFFKSTEHQKSHNPVVFLNLNSKDGSVNSNLEIELYENISPLSSDNFRQFCKGFVNDKGNQLSFQGLNLNVDPRSLLLTSEYVKDNIYGNQRMYHENYEGLKKIYIQYC